MLQSFIRFSVQKVKQEVKELLGIVLLVLDKLTSFSSKGIQELAGSDTGVVDVAISSLAHWLSVHSLEESAQFLVEWSQSLLSSNERTNSV